MGSIISIDKPPEEPPPLDVPTEPEHQEATAAGLWQRMMEHAIGAAAATLPEVGTPEDDDHEGDGPIVTLLARAPTSLHLGVDADDEIWRAAARTGSQPREKCASVPQGVFRVSTPLRGLETV